MKRNFRKVPIQRLEGKFYSQVPTAAVMPKVEDFESIIMEIPD